jgi:hypothetical protein
MRDDLAALCAIGGERLRQVVERINAAPFTIRRSQIETIISESLGAEEAAPIVRVLFGIAGTFRRDFSSASAVLEALTRSINALPNGDERLKPWPDCKEALGALLASRSLSLAAKALDISYDFERVYVAGRILTSVRPVFDEQREEIMGSTIVQTLRVEFLAPNGDESSISVAVDLDDIHRLKEECTRAIEKAKIVRERIQKDCHIEAIIPGEETNG